MEAHSHADATEDEELLGRRRHAKLLAQLDELEQRVRAVEHPNLCTRDGFEDFSAPLVDQMRRAQDERTAIAFGMQDRGQRNADRGFSGAHFAIYEDSPLALIDEQFRGRMYDLCLGREQLALQACQNQLAVRTRRTAIDGWVGAIEESSNSSPNSETKS